MVKVFVDTSALMALLDPADERRGDTARRWLVEHADARLETHNYVVTEALSLVERRLGRQAAIALRARVLPLATTRWIDWDQHERALEAHFDSSRRSSFVDQVSFVVMRDAGIDTAFAFDDDFARAGFTVVP